VTVEWQSLARCQPEPASAAQADTVPASDTQAACPSHWHGRPGTVTVTSAVLRLDSDTITARRRVVTVVLAGPPSIWNPDNLTYTVIMI
jgi:hypothetical protein